MFPQMFSLNLLNLLNSMTEIFVITVKGLKPAIRMLSQCQKDTCKRQDFSTEPNSFFSDFIRFPEFSEFNEFLFYLETSMY